MAVADRIKKRREELGLTLEDVAKVLGVSKSTVSRYETSEIENMGIDKLENLARVLRVSPVELLGWSGGPEPKGEEEAAVMVKKELAPAVDLLNRLSPEDREIAVQMLRRLAKSE